MRKKEKNAAKGFFNGFKEFVTKGNVIDLAVGVVIGAAFGKIVTSLVNDIIMPPIGVLINGVDFKDLVITLKQAQEATATAAAIPAITINYGNFIMSIIEFVLIAFSIYAVLTLVIRRRQFIEKLEAEQKAIEEANKPKEEVVVEVSEEILLLREINENLKKQKE